jgi:two-component system KDP operon response regulator KdpE
VAGDPEMTESIALATQLRWPLYQLVTTCTGEKTIALARTENPDVIILDLQLPDALGFEVIERVRSFSSVPIVALVIQGEENEAARALECGADDCAGKPCGQTELLARVEARMRDKDRFAGAQLHTYGDIVLEPQNLRLRHGGRVTELTPLEAGLVSCLIRGGGSVVTYDRLLEAAWDSDFAGALDSLRLHVSRLREKVETDPADPQIILTAPGEGYFLAWKN